MITIRTIDDLKAAGHYFAAGALAAEMNADRDYGCHFGMRSDRDVCRALFYAGYDAVQHTSR